MYVPLRKAVEQLGLHPNTLRRYADEGKIRSIKNGGKQRLFDVQSYINQSVSGSVPSTSIDEIMFLINLLSEEDRKELVKKICRK